MPTKILHKEKLIPGRTSKLVLDAPQIAATARPGHFVILRVDEKGERFPLTIADTDKEHGTITIVYLVLGRSTQMLEELEEGQFIHDVCGPLGRATCIERFEAPKKVICVGGGVSNQGEVLLGPVRAYVEKETHDITGGRVPEIRACELRNDAGVIGAAALEVSI